MKEQRALSGRASTDGCLSHPELQPPGAGDSCQWDPELNISFHGWKLIPAQKLGTSVFQLVASKVDGVQDRVGMVAERLGHPLHKVTVGEKGHPSEQAMATARRHGCQPRSLTRTCHQHLPTRQSQLHPKAEPLQGWAMPTGLQATNSELYAVEGMGHQHPLGTWVHGPPLLSCT